MEEDEIQLRSEEVQEILSHIPNWLIRWGITLIFIIIGLLLAGSWFIKYPEIISSRATVATLQPPIHLVAKSAGKIQLLVKDRQTIAADSYLATLENTANTADVQLLKTQLQTAAKSALTSTCSSISALPLLQLGELQNDYSILLQACKDYTFFMGTDFYKSKTASIQTQYTYYKNLNEKLSGQAAILYRELELAQKKYTTDQKLFSEGVIAQIDLARSESDYLQKKYAQRNAEISLVNNKIQLEEYTKTLLDLDQNYEESKRKLSNGLQEAIKRMQAALTAWEQRYVILSPMAGTVSFFKFYSNNQYVNLGEEILTVIPKSGPIMAKLTVPAMGIGKVQEGQKVNIKLDSYPFKEFGMVEGRVESISSVTRDNFYLVNVSLPKGLNTTYHHQLKFKQEMSGTAEIITKDLRLFERIFNQLRSLIQKSV